MNKFLISIVVIFLGVLGIFLYQKPHSHCDSQRELFVEAQRGYLFPKISKIEKFKAPQYNKFATQCKNGRGAGGCFEYFKLLKKILRDLQASDVKCLASMAEIGQIEAGIKTGIKIIVSSAWGSEPPASIEGRVGWLETPDLVLFCGLKRYYEEIYGSEMFKEMMVQTLADLPGEPIRLKADGGCENCELRRKASEILTSEEIWAKSLFSIRCDVF